MPRMMLSPILWAALGLACVSPSNAGSAADGIAKDPRIQAPPARELNSPETRQSVTGSSGMRPSAKRPTTIARPGVGSNSTAAPLRRGSAAPQPGIRQGVGGAKGLRSPLNTPARGPVARRPVQALGSIPAASGGPGLHGPSGFGAAGRFGAAGPTQLAALKPGALPAPAFKSIPRNSAVGGPRVQNLGRLGGAVIGGATHTAVIDGSALRRK
jgi:hypothetical protein